MPIAWVAWVMEKPEKKEVGCKILEMPNQSHYIDERLKRLIIELRQSDDDYTVQLLQEIAEYVNTIEEHPVLDQCFFKLEEAILWYQTWVDLQDESSGE